MKDSGLDDPQERYEASASEDPGLLHCPTHWAWSSHKIHNTDNS
jgi:hypothetical protein